MRETSLDEFIGEDGGGEDDDASGDGTGGDDAGRGSVDAAAASSQGDEVEDVEPAGEGVEADVEGGGEFESRTGSESRTESEGPTDVESEDGRKEAPEPDAVEPAVSTYDWTPTGADCQACGTAVERRWRDDGRLVCADCKAW